MAKMVMLEVNMKQKQKRFIIIDHLGNWQLWNI